MYRIIRLLASASFVCSLAVTSSALAQEPSILPSQDLTTWARTVPGSQLQEIAIGRQLSGEEVLRPFAEQAVVGLGISGVVHFASDRGMVRVIVTDDALQDYLVYESYPLIAGATEFDIRDACRETCVLLPTVGTTVKVEVVDASLFLRTIVVNRATGAAARTLAVPQVPGAEQVKDAQEKEIVDTLNRQIKAKGLQWTAGETDFSRLSYAERRKLLACAAPGPNAPPPNSQGAEYYTGGIFTVRSEGDAAAQVVTGSAFIPAFDWRSQHRANSPGSPYFDGDLTGGGWMTPVKNQRCADCWAHSALGATEALTNLYFNQHLDLDLSEQALVSCSGAGTCVSGGNTGGALSYVQRIGVVDEACFPESGRDQPCTNCCSNPRDRIRLASYEYIYPMNGRDDVEREDNIKRRLIASGPLAFGIASWWHALVLVGYDTDPTTGQPVWILKNSWGTGWGEHGYGRVVVPLTDMYLMYELHPPMTSLVASYTTACRDADGDGYFNWGLGADPAVVCGAVNPIEDCDDSDPTVAIRTASGACTAPAPTDKTPPVITMTASPTTLWPPNGKMVPVTVSGTITDTGSGVDPTGVAFAVTDENAQIQPSGAIALGPGGTYSLTVLLEASRTGHQKDGRRYTITVTAQDVAGNSGSMPTVITVPHDMRAKE